MADAFEMYCSGYLMKPITVEKIRDEMTVTDEEVEMAMETLGLTLIDLLKPENIGALTVSSDFLFGARSTTGSVQNSGIISVGGNWESNDIYNWGWISVRKRIKRKNIKIHNEGRIIEYGNN